MATAVEFPNGLLLLAGAAALFRTRPEHAAKNWQRFFATGMRLKLLLSIKLSGL
jgi:hypothetical protein